MLRKELKNLVFMNIAKEIAKLSTCANIKVGCVIVKNDEIVSLGYNGVTSGRIHCEDVFNNKENIADFHEIHSVFSTINEIHAEQNAIIRADKEMLKDSILYCNFSPCINCAKLICLAGIKKVYYSYDYKDIDTTKKIFENHDIELIKI